MTAPPLPGLNLNALFALQALLSECNVTRAARRVGVSQPAMSQTLSKLRELFDDPLLLRTPRGLVRTKKAEGLLVPLSDALQSVVRAVQLGMGFDPATSSRIFKVAMTDLHLTMALPGLLGAIERRAPEVRVQAEALSGRGLVEELSAGEVDLAVGFAIGAMPGLRSETLLTDEFACLVRRGHPLARRKRASLADYARHRHLANTPVGFIPRELSGVSLGFGARSGIQVSVPSLLALPSIVRHTNLVATVPRRLLAAPLDLSGIVTLGAPIELPPVVHTMWWHDRFDRDPAHEWLRARVREAVG